MNLCIPGNTHRSSDHVCVYMCVSNELVTLETLAGPVVSLVAARSVLTRHHVALVDVVLTALSGEA